jgi:hypothetical protein
MKTMQVTPYKLDAQMIRTPKYKIPCSDCGTEILVYRKDKRATDSCRKCYRKVYDSKRDPKQRQRNNPNRFLFRDKRVVLENNPRIGVCNLCRAVMPFDCKKTDMHHEEYDESDVLKYAMEICVSCHRKITIRRQRRDMRDIQELKGIVRRLRRLKYIE